MSKQNIQTALEEIEKYNMKYGTWHLGSCHFLFYDEEVCECNSSKIRRNVKGILVALSAGIISKEE